APRARRPAGPPRAGRPPAGGGERPPATVGGPGARGPQRHRLLHARGPRHRGRAARAAGPARAAADLEGERHGGRHHARGARARRPLPPARRPADRGGPADLPRARARRPPVSRAHRARGHGVRGPRRGREALPGGDLPQVGRL
ncbi:MAG: hypothetical protein AVDCRST_MAG13-1291, partial [uncultured Solirubrobacteraceae bacterium]